MRFVATPARTDFCADFRLLSLQLMFGCHLREPFNRISNLHQVESRGQHLNSSLLSVELLRQVFRNSWQPFAPSHDRRRSFQVNQRNLSEHPRVVKRHLLWFIQLLQFTFPMSCHTCLTIIFLPQRPNILSVHFDRPVARRAGCCSRLNQ